MIGIILISVSWVLLRVQKRTLSEIGFNKPMQRTCEFLAGLLIAGFFATSQFFLIGFFSEFRWVVNPEYNLSQLLESLRWNFNSVVYEELVFRGYLLYKAIEYFGVKKACYFSAAAFGIYHWFSYGIFGNIIPMIYVFFFNGSFWFNVVLFFLFV